MPMFAFVAGIVVLFLALLACETENVGARIRAHKTGLLAWLVSGNWPVKVGAALLMIGVGALLRYPLIHVDVSPGVRPGSGVVIAAPLGYLSYRLRYQTQWRGLQLALAGATCGVAYLTAYSAYGLFEYVTSATGVALLAIVSGAMGILAVTMSGGSIAVLAMIGAYAAPVPAVWSPGPMVTYGYYLATSALRFFMMLALGWRPLIHLSLLFTLICRPSRN